MSFNDSFNTGSLVRASVIFALCGSSLTVMAQASRIRSVIDNRQRVNLTGHIHPKARAGVDQGRVSPSLSLSNVTLTFAQTDSQKADLDQLLIDQQNPAAPNYRHWLTPEEYAQRFGLDASDLNQISSWLQAQGLTITSTARGRGWISFSGTAAQMENAFQTELHQYVVNGETHFANATDPSVPAALGGVVKTIRGLNDFRMKPAGLRPQYTSGRSGNHYLAPDDFATIYNVKSLYNAGIDGTGQQIVVAGQTAINMSDITTFRSTYNLPTNNPQTLLVPGSRNPGISQGDLGEADLDIELAGSVARNASLTYVYAYDVMNAVQYAIDQNMAPVVSVSYGSCEAETPQSDALTMQSWARQGNAQGITWFAASGDAGGADCDDSQNPGLSVDLPAGIPEVTGLGGTEFVEGSGSYWNSTNNANGASVLSYIPETTWNDSVQDGSPSASGGGASIFFQKPSWQVGTGVPSDNARHVPDISLSASADHDGYLIYSGGGSQPVVYGGTSVAAPSMAGIAVLLNQYLVSTGGTAGLGNLNPKLYSIAASTTNVFHDITTGNNLATVGCSRRSINCNSSAVGYSAGVGYDQATGLGSLDAFALAGAYSGAGIVTTPKSDTITLSANSNNIASNQVVFLIATVTGADGNTPTGSVTFATGGSALGTVSLVGSGGIATATLSVQGSQLSQSSGAITAQYSGAASSAAITVGVSSTGSSATPSVAALTNAASYKQVYAPGEIMTVWGSQLSPNTQSAASVPLPVSMSGVAVLVNGVAAPLYYVSSTLLNIQIPYETAPSGTAVLTINNNGQVTTRNFTMGAVAPGIFTDANLNTVPNTSAARGQIISVYVTGYGAVSPEVADGAAPATSIPLTSLPKPTQNVTVSVGGVPASINFIGVPYGLSGVLLINYQVPTTVGLGQQPVVVSVGGVASSAAVVSITN